SGVIEHTAHARRRHHPSIGAAVPVEPGSHLRVPLAETAGRNADPDADGKAALGHGDHFMGISAARRPARATRAAHSRVTSKRANKSNFPSAVSCGSDWLFPRLARACSSEI